MEFRLRNINPLLNSSITKYAKENEMSKNEFILKVLEDYFVEEKVEIKKELIEEELKEIILLIERNTKVMSELIGMTYELMTENEIEKDIYEFEFLQNFGDFDENKNNK